MPPTTTFDAPVLQSSSEILSESAVIDPHRPRRPVVLYFDGTFVHRQNGAHFRVASLLTYLLRCGCNVTMYSYANHVECPWGAAEIDIFKKQFPTVPLVLDHHSSALRYLYKIKKKISGIFPKLVTKLMEIRLPLLTPEYDKIRNLYPDALYIINYANGLLELNGVDPEGCAIETHDLDFLQFSKKFGYDITSIKISEKFRSEFSLLQIALVILSISKTETGMFRLFFPKKTIFFLPDYGSLRIRPSAPRAGGYDYDMLFVGSRNSHNVDGIVAFLASQTALLQRFSLAIAGEVSLNPKVVKAASNLKDVSLLGFVDDLTGLYERAKIVIAPVDGTGLKIKVIEALAAGKPVFGSRHSLDGLPAGSDDCAFLIDAAQITRILSDEDRLNSAADAALAYSKTLANSGDLAEFRSFLDRVGASQSVRHRL